MPQYVHIIVTHMCSVLPFNHAFASEVEGLGSFASSTPSRSSGMKSRNQGEEGPLILPRQESHK